MNFTHIFFDLDHTLWDYEFNSRKVLEEMYAHFGLGHHLTSTCDEFINHFEAANATLWHSFNLGEISRDQIRNDRFVRILQSCGCANTSLGDSLSEYYLYHCPRQTRIMEDADVTLDYLRRKYHLSIITNGFDDVQYIKLKSCGLDRYFEHVFTSDGVGHKKPDAAIFLHALEVLKVDKSRVLMIGDNPVADIMGARNAGITPLLFNPFGTTRSDCQLQVSRLTELMKIL